MTSNKITAIVLTALAGLGLVKYFQMSKQEREDLMDGIKERLHELLDDAEGASDRMKGYMSQLKSTHEHNWLDKLVVVKKIVDELKPVRDAGNKFGQAAAAAASRAGGASGESSNGPRNHQQL